MLRTTLCYPIRNGQVLLAMKKRGQGEGKWNGPGGKVQNGESVEDACRREIFEEVGVTVSGLARRGMARFVYEGKPEWNNECDVFIATEIEGEPIETEEMRPQWFSLDALPYEHMWESDPLWLPGVLVGGTVDRTFYFDAEGKLVKY